MTQPTKKATVGKIQLCDDGIYLITAKKGKKTKRRIADPIVVTAFATSDPGTPREQAFTVIKFVNRRGNWKKEIVSSSMLERISAGLNRDSPEDLDRRMWWH